MGLFSDHPNPVNPDIIAWSTKEAPLLPIYLGGAVLMFMWTFNSLTQGLMGAAFFAAAAASYLGWRSFRAYEQHRDLKRLQNMYDRGWL